MKNIVILIVYFVIGMSALILINQNPNQGFLDKEPTLYINAPKGYEISFGYREPYYDTRRPCPIWRDQIYKNPFWMTTLKESGDALFAKDSSDTDIVIFIRKIKP